MKKYQSYKSTGIGWIGEIPEHWETIKTFIITKNLDGKRIPLNSEEREKIEGEYPYWGSNGIVDYINKYIFDEEIVLVGEDGSPFFDRFKDVSFYIKEKVWVNNHIHILKTKQKILPQFLTHSFNCVEYREFITGSTRDKLTQSDLKRIPHCVPPINEQEQIIQHLDEKTSVIDKLISIKKSKIELLNEQRIILINQVITKGLNPNVKMKDSGVEWIGEIPEHWIKNKLKHCLSQKPDNGLFKRKDDFGDGVRFVNVSNLFNSNNIIDINGLERVNITKEELIKSRLENGDIFFVRSSLKLEGIGVSSIIKNIEEDVVYDCHIIRIKPNKNKLNPDFLITLLNSISYRNYLISVSESVTMTTISQDKIKEIIFYSPTIQEQQEILEYLEKHIKEIDDLVSMEQKKIELLKEYRKSLISEVITGKIKVVE
jgi:type I restriction enzyme S subunit